MLYAEIRQKKPDQRCQLRFSLGEHTVPKVRRRRLLEDRGRPVN